MATKMRTMWAFILKLFPIEMPLVVFQHDRERPATMRYGLLSREHFPICRVTESFCLPRMSTP